MSVRAYRWSALVPIATNPLILLDVLLVLFVAGGAAVSALLLAQWFFAGFVSIANVAEAFLLALLLDALFLALFFAGVFLFLRNRYVAVYMIDERGIYCENIRPARFTPPDGASFFMTRAVLLSGQVDVSKSTVRKIYWREVARIEELPEIGVLVLKGRRGTLLRLYCPRGTTWTDVLSLSGAFLAESRGERGES